MTEKVTVLYVGGRGRSGSTILARTLGQIPNFVNVGELWQVWSRGLRENAHCGCGQPFHSCEFWRAVGDEAFGGWNNADVDKMVAFTPYLDSLRYAPHYALAVKTGIRSCKISTMLQECEPVLERLYRAIQRVSGAGVIVDSSKRFSYVVLLSLLPWVDLRVVHLVRDSRAVAYSWARSRESAEGRRLRSQGYTLAARLSPTYQSRAWSVQNYSYSLLSDLAPTSRLRYEDFVNDPTSCLAETLLRLGLDDEAGGFPVVRERKVSLSADHTVSGNPGRFRTGSIELRPDEEWKVKMRGADRRIVTVLTAPLLLKYGYLARERNSRVGAQG